MLYGITTCMPNGNYSIYVMLSNDRLGNTSQWGVSAVQEMGCANGGSFCIAASLH